MPIIKTESLSGVIFVAAGDAEEAQKRAAQYLLDKSRDYRIFDDKAAAEREAADMGRHYEEGYFRAYAVTIDIRTTDQ